MNENAINEWNIKIWCLTMKLYKKEKIWNEIIYFIEISIFRNS